MSDTHTEHRILDRTPKGLLVEITTELKRRSTTTEYLIRSIGIQCEAYSLEKPEGEAYASFGAEAVRYVCTVGRDGQVRCTCKGGIRWGKCKHSITVERLRDSGDLGQSVTALVARIQHQEETEVFV